MATRFQQPAMNSLIAFEAAARTGSFTRAAEELQVSQPAVSHAMRLLEDDLGLPLFERRHKGVHTTDAGQHLLDQVSLGLTLIDQALREVRSMTHAQPVTLAVSTATATWWLLPRIARFKQLHPDIELRCITTPTPIWRENASTWQSRWAPASSRSSSAGTLWTRRSSRSAAPPFCRAVALWRMCRR